jgi:hypothetical protein
VRAPSRRRRPGREAGPVRTTLSAAGSYGAPREAAHASVHGAGIPVDARSQRHRRRRRGTGRHLRQAAERATGGTEPAASRRVEEGGAAAVEGEGRLLPRIPRPARASPPFPPPGTGQHLPAIDSQSVLACGPTPLDVVPAAGAGRQRGVGNPGRGLGGDHGGRRGRHARGAAPGTGRGGGA